MLKNMSLQAKLILVSTLSFVVIGLLVIGVVSFQMVNYNQTLMRELTVKNDTTIDKVVGGIENSVKSLTKDIANTQRIKTDIQSNNMNALSNLVNSFLDLKENPDFFCVVTDQTGKIIYTTLGQNLVGTDVSTQPPAKAALSGKSGVGFETTKLVKLAIRAYSPIYDDSGKLIGTVHVGKKISDSNLFVDQLKKDTGSDVTWYLGDERVATTLEDVKVGSKQENQKIIEEVLKNGESPIVKTEHGGKSYLTRFGPIKDSSGNIIGMNSTSISTAEYDNYFRNIFLSLIGTIILVCIVLIGIFLAFIKRSIAKPISSLTKGIEDLSTGDFTLKLPEMNKDELGRIREAVEKLRGYLVDILSRINKIQSEIHSSSKDMLEVSKASKLAAGESKKASENMADAATNLSQSAQEISNQVQQLLSAIDSIASGSESLAKSASNLSERTAAIADKSVQIATDAKAVDELTNNVNKDAREGAKIIQETQNTMNAIVVSVENLSSVMNSLKERSLEIGKIVDVISGIAEQTNLLALNAAIEAARAGDAGRGFAVVADEVRKLAEESQKAAVEIGNMINQTIKETENAANSMNETKEGVLKGSSMSDRTSEAFKNILSAIEKLSEKIDTTTQNITTITKEVQEIESEVSNLAALSEENSASSEEMAASAKEISTNVEGIAATSEEMAASSEEVAASAQESETMAEQIDKEANKLAERADELKNELDKYKFYN
ncbi:methyl-accepting chemotaxis sensory transducer [Thermodesulfobium narugense DSM 14796]|uniref:Methyl-accepting chemotaxis sensory transducer n=1 Tax=Thermodesulfobium narugense DSM 14796 TaxID=747365 RepID=M1E7M4_9BACT|nr:methyl-accepting chemotaxis protein [Thermodesulfobium narugense]AEE15316.1 methyl-accepting chemotaxis sensory transducer [Thermodesulfobium narugense DSM 14796]